MTRVTKGDVMTKTLTALVTAATVAAAAIATPTTADARNGWIAGGVIGGLAAGAIIGGALAAPYYYGGGPYYSGYGGGPFITAAALTITAMARTTPPRPPGLRLRLLAPRAVLDRLRLGHPPGSSLLTNPELHVQTSVWLEAVHGLQHAFA